MKHYHVKEQLESETDRLVRKYLEKGGGVKKGEYKKAFKCRFRKADRAIGRVKLN